MSLCSFDLMMVLRSTETRNVNLKNLTLFSPKSEPPRVRVPITLRDLRITIVMVNMMELAIRLRNDNTSMGFEIRGNDSRFEAMIPS